MDSPQMSWSIEDVCISCKRNEVPHPVTASELQAVPSNLPAQSSGTVKRKPLPIADRTFLAQGSDQPSPSAPIRVGEEQDQATRRPASPVLSPPETILSQNEVSSAAATPTWITETPAAAAASVQSPMQPAYSESCPQVSTANSTNEPAAAVSSHRPPLRHAQTVPQPAPREADSSQMRRFSASQPRSLASVTNAFDKRKSVSQLWSSSLETGKKLANNRFVKAGVKYTANMAVRAVVKEVVGDVLDVDFASSNDGGQASGDGGGGLMNQVFNSNADGMTSSPTDFQMSQVDVTDLVGPGPAASIQPGFDTVTTTDPMTDLFQQQQAAAIGLNTALQEQNWALQEQNTADEFAIQESQQFQLDMQYQAGQMLDWGTDAVVPGFMANSYGCSAASDDGFDGDGY